VLDSARASLVPDEENASRAQVFSLRLASPSADQLIAKGEIDERQNYRLPEADLNGVPGG
jgi:Tfp pilus assembly ATPase PilU